MFSVERNGFTIVSTESELNALVKKGESCRVETIKAGVSTVDGEIIYFVEKALKQGEHKTPPKGYPEKRKEYAVPSVYAFPIDDEEHVRAALSYFHKHRFDSNEQKKEAAKRIMSAAKKHGVDVSRDSDVAHSAGIKKSEPSEAQKRAGNYPKKKLFSKD